MSKPTDEYWIERATRREERTSKFTDDLVRQVKAMHDRAQDYIEEEIRAIIRTYRRKGLLSHEEAQKILNTVESSETLKELRDTLQDVEDSDARRELLSRINAPAYRHRLTRLQAMQDRIDAECTRLASQMITREREAFITVLQEEFNRHLFDIEKGTSITLDFTPIPSEAVDEAVNHSWHGQDYADSVWKNTHEVAKAAKDIVQDGMLSGKSVARMTAQLRERFQTAKYKAERVIRTEMNYLHNQADLQVYKRLGTERYRFLATLDSTTCKKCGALDNRMFPVSEATVGKNYPPLHPNDRCTTVPVIEGEDISKGKRRYRDPITGKNGGLVSANMTYEQWAALQDAKHGAGTIDKLRRMAYNRSADKAQFERYKHLLKDKAPSNFESFQKIKYNHGYEDLRRQYADVKLQQRIRKGFLNTTVHKGKQGKHIPGHNNYIEGRSYLVENLDVQKIVNKYAGTGTIMRSKKGKWEHKETVITDRIVGYNVSMIDGTTEATHTCVIHYSHEGVHIVPKKEAQR